jgi:hypothetical protein
LLPLALTKAEEAGAPLIQQGSGAYPAKRWSSWYDKKLVIDKGEKVLADLDTWAIPELRKKHLVWSGWGPMVRLADHKFISEEDGVGARRIDTDEPKRLRMFLLSLLWRAAATDLFEFDEVELPAADLEELRTLVLNNDPGRIDFYPMTLIQLSTKGFGHNLSPIAQVKTIPSLAEDQGARDLPIFRFYFDGLIVHVHRHASDDGYTASLGDIIVGASRDLLVTTVTFERSFQVKNIAYILTESLQRA